MQNRFLITSALTVGAVVSAMVLAQPALAKSGKDYFKGKTVEWIVTTSPGGGHDFWGRLLSRHMSKRLDAKFVVKKYYLALCLVAICVTLTFVMLVRKNLMTMTMTMTMMMMRC